MPDVTIDSEMTRIIEAAHRYEQWAFEEIYNRYADKLFRFLLLRVGSRPEAEDLVAEAFVRILHRIDTFQGKTVASFSAWIYRVARNLLVDHYRHRAKRETTSLDARYYKLVDTNSEPHKKTVESQANKELYDAIANLTPDQQQVVVFKFFEGMSNAEIARILGKTEGAVKSLQHRALSALQRFLADEEKSEF